MSTSKLRTSADFLALTISAGEGKYEYLHNEGKRNYRYTVTVKSDATGARTSFTFHGSIADYEAGKRTLDHDELLWAFRCFVEDARHGLDSEDFADFANEFGYDEDSYRAREVYKACKEAARKFGRLFHDAKRFTPAYVLEMLELEGIE